MIQSLSPGGLHHGSCSYFFLQLKWVAWLMPALRQISATKTPSPPCFRMNGLLRVRELGCLHRFPLPPAREIGAENSNQKRSGFRESDQPNDELTFHPDHSMGAGQPPASAQRRRSTGLVCHRRAENPGHEGHSGDAAQAEGPATGVRLAQPPADARRREVRNPRGAERATGRRIPASHLIHLAKTQHAGQVCDRAPARSALAALDRAIRDLTDSR